MPDHPVTVPVVDPDNPGVTVNLHWGLASIMVDAGFLELTLYVDGVVARVSADGHARLRKLRAARMAEHADTSAEREQP